MNILMHWFEELILIGSYHQVPSTDTPVPVFLRLDSLGGFY